MKAVLTVLLLVLTGCGNCQTFQAKDFSYFTLDTGLHGGAIATAPNGDFVIGGQTDAGNTEFRTSSDGGKTWVSRLTVTMDRKCGPISMTVVNGAIYTNVESEGYETGSHYQTDIYKSTDNGVTWTDVGHDPNYLYMFSRVVDGSKVAVALNYVPPMPSTNDGYGNEIGYKYGHVDFGWYDTATEMLTVVSRIASRDDEPGNFPSEVFLYQRPSDKGIVAIVRWGEAPNVPYQKPLVSTNSGLTFTSLGVTWQGLAGSIQGCTTDKGSFWFAGYEEPNPSTTFSVIYRDNPNTAEVLDRHYPFGAGIYGNHGNGGITCKGNTVAAMVGNGTAQFVSFEE